MLKPNPSQSSRRTGEEFRSRGATQAPAQDQFNHLPNPISYLPNQFKHLLSPISYLPNQFNHLPNPLSYLPNPLQQPPEFIVVQLELMSNQFSHLPNQLQQLQRLKLKHNWLKSPEDHKQTNIISLCIIKT